LHFHYLVCLLLPVLKQISEDQHTELETEAKNTGSNYHSSDFVVCEYIFVY
jgi:lysine-specific demethylase 3